MFMLNISRTYLFESIEFEQINLIGFLLSAILLITLFSSTCAFAENQEVSWTGPYVGLTGGHTWGISSMNLTPSGRYLTNLTDAIPVLENGGSPTYNTNGFMGGAEIGYNYQINHLVLGLEGGFEYQDLSQSQQTDYVPIVGADTVAFDGNFKSEWISTVRTRLGYSTGNLLGFVTGGLAIADYNFSSGYTINELGYLFNAQASSSQILTGWTVGAGAEYALADQWSVKAEYLYANFPNVGSVSSLITDPNAFPNFTAVHGVYNLSQHIARVGVNYRF